MFSNYSYLLIDCGALWLVDCPALLLVRRRALTLALLKEIVKGHPLFKAVLVLTP